MFARTTLPSWSIRAKASVAALRKCSVALAKQRSMTSGGEAGPKGSGADVIYALGLQIFDPPSPG
jgi:hypothetical protein